MRVIAIRNADENEVNIYGYGEYVGNEPCPIFYNMLDSKIVLDNGKIVWGCQCWWGNAERCEREIILGRKINIVESPENEQNIRHI